MMGKQDDEDAVDQLLSGLLDVVPTIPITDEALEIFLTTLKAIIPEIDINLDEKNNVDEDNISPDEEPDFYAEKINGDNVKDIISDSESKQKKMKKLE